MALCESQLDALPAMTREDSSEPEAVTSQADTSSNETQRPISNDALYGLDQGALPLTVDYRSPVSHFIPPAVELYAKNSRPEIASTESSQSPTPVKRKRGRPRIDKTSPEYLAKSAAKKKAKEIAASANNSSSETGEKRKRGRPRIDKTSPEYLARKRAKELEALEKKAKRQYKRRATGDSAASSSTDTTPRTKRKYTKKGNASGQGRPKKNNDGTPVKGKRGRPRKVDLMAAGLLSPGGANMTKRSGQEGRIRVRSNLMPVNSEPISLDSEDEPDLGSPSQTSDSLSLEENLRALAHLREKYANLGRDDEYLGTAAENYRTAAKDQYDKDRVEKLEDSSNSDSDSSSSGSSSSSSSSSSSNSGSSSSSSDSSDDDSGEGRTKKIKNGTSNDVNNEKRGVEDETSYGAWSYKSDSDSSPGSARARSVSPAQSLSESDNESVDKTFQCHVCRKWYSTLVTLKIHRRVHLNRGSGSSRSRNRTSDRYECDCCSETFNRREKLWEHKASAHRGSMTVRCAVCRRCFEDDAELAAHDSTHTADERAGRCTSCGQSFPRYELLRRHQAAAHPPAPGHACPQCGKGFGHAHSLTRHLHNHQRQLYKCVVCKASFARADQLAQHLNSHLANYKRLKP